MNERVKEILSSDVLILIRKKEAAGHNRYDMILKLLTETDKPVKELLEEYPGDEPGKEERLPEDTGIYRNLLAEAILTELALKEELANLQAPTKEDKESEEKGL